MHNIVNYDDHAPELFHDLRPGEKMARRTNEPMSGVCSPLFGASPSSIAFPYNRIDEEPTPLFTNDMLIGKNHRLNSIMRWTATHPIGSELPLHLCDRHRLDHNGRSIWRGRTMTVLKNCSIESPTQCPAHNLL